MIRSRQAKQTGSTLVHGWKLGEAKAKFSDVFRLSDHLGLVKLMRSADVPG